MDNWKYLVLYKPLCSKGLVSWTLLRRPRTEASLKSQKFLLKNHMLNNTEKTSLVQTRITDDFLRIVAVIKGTHPFWITMEIYYVSLPHCFQSTAGSIELHFNDIIFQEDSVSQQWPILQTSALPFITLPTTEDRHNFVYLFNLLDMDSMENLITIILISGDLIWYHTLRRIICYSECWFNIWSSLMWWGLKWLTQLSIGNPTIDNYM